ncbi:OprO/OprP family phosphate-selective porin [Akkermansiaceae bacterium]|nr:OprO/OprP family phosphate-selective porin [Akkermansiaceae bacterium]
MKHKLIQAIGAGFVAATSGAFAGDVTVIPVSEPEPCGDWCDTLKNIGTVYKDKENPFIQEVKFFGRAHYQWGHTDGEIGGADFDGKGDELRRLRFGTSVKFLNGFKLNARANFENGGFRDTSIRYSGFDELYLEYGLGDVAGFEDVTVGYGLYKVAFGGEETESSKKIKTVERSNINNFYAPSRATGVLIEAKKNDIDFTLGVFTVDSDPETWGQWNGGVAYFGSMAFEACNGDVMLDLLINDSTVAEDEVIGYDWAASATYETKVAGFDLFTNVTFGETHAGDNVHGIVIMPSTELIEDKLEAVVRYQWARSSGADLLRPQSRNVRNTAGLDGIGVVPRGDENHTIYGGLNYFLCGHNAKLMAGVEYETVSGGVADTDATTFWLAARMFF